MIANFATQAEFLEKTGMTHRVLAELEKAKVLRPSGQAEDHAPIYGPEALASAEHVQKLMESGYGLEEAIRILKKIGLPKSFDRKKSKSSRESFLTVGALADKVEVSPRTIKHWEDKGIIEPDMRSEGGFRMYSRIYVSMCQLIKDLQVFGYSLDEIKTVSDHFRDFLALSRNLSAFPREEGTVRIEAMFKAVADLTAKMDLMKGGIKRWEDLLKKQRRELRGLREKLRKTESPDSASRGKKA